jgi:hypothetical protein
MEGRPRDKEIAIFEKKLKKFSAVFFLNFWS